MNALKPTIISICFVLTSHIAIASNFEWTVNRNWTATDEENFTEFISIMGESGCRSFKSCITGKKSNPFYYKQTPKSGYPADCADFPYTLRMYFAWMNHLTFDYVLYPTQANPEKETSQDIRYTKYGNKPYKHKKFLIGESYNAKTELTRLINNVSTATYRMHYKYKSDFYPTKLDQANIQPGTVLYDPAGHAAIVYRIEKNGRIKMMDAHPDNSVSRITFDKKFVRSRPGHGAGFRNWRPELNNDKTADLMNFSTEQFDSSFYVSGEKVSYYDYVRIQMAGGNLKFNPVEEMKTTIKEICTSIEDRIHSVDAAIKAGLDNKKHPKTLPENIYGTHGEWESYSTPSRDARLKVSFVELLNDVSRFIDLYNEGSDRIVYNKTESDYSFNCDSSNESCFLIGSLMEAYKEVAESPSCQFTYEKTNNETVNLNFTDVSQRLFKLSFDPYHCVELRWGASSSSELNSCPSNSNKVSWYNAEQGLRNQIERKYDLKMNFGLHNGVEKLGVENSPNVDLWGMLTELVF